MKRLTPPYFLQVYKGGSCWGYQYRILKDGVFVVGGMIGSLRKLPLVTEMIITLNNAARKL